MKLNEKLKALRKDLGLTLKETSLRLGIPLTTYAGYEQGVREPSLEMLYQLCKFFDVTSKVFEDEDYIEQGIAVLKVYMQILAIQNRYTCRNSTKEDSIRNIGARLFPAPRRAQA